MTNSKFLITGGAGFIGSNFVHYWLGNHPETEVIVLDALTYAGNRENLSTLENNPNFRFIHGDIRSNDLVENLLRDENVNSVVHFAAESHVDRSILGPDLFIDTNIIGTHNILKAAKKVWVDEGQCINDHRFHHVSTDEVYGSLSLDDPAFHESTPYNPNSPYAASKAASDHLVRAYHRTYGLNISITNCSNNYGPYQFPEKLIPLIIINALDGKDLPVYGDGLNIRDWLYVKDHCRAIELILERGVSGDTYNVGGKCELKNIDLVNIICNHIDNAFKNNPDLTTRFPDSPAGSIDGCASLIKFVEDRPGHDTRYAINQDKIEGELGFELIENLKTGMESTVNWYIKNEKWWRQLLNIQYEDWIKLQYKE
jgi:dTDP-glucose 4,6-dehydratase